VRLCLKNAAKEHDKHECFDVEEDVWMYVWLCVFL